MLPHIHWLGHSGIKIIGSKVVYVDPYHIEDTQTADFILITHDHYDHYSPDDIEKISGDKTQLIISFKIPTLQEDMYHLIAVDDILEFDDLEIKATPAYNIGKKYHPVQHGNVGYVIKLDGKTYYHAGDTDVIPEMKDIRTDVAFLPVSGTFTMNPHEAAQAAEMIKPGLAVPIHWGSVAGSRDDAELFVKLCTQCKAQILTHK